MSTDDRIAVLETDRIPLVIRGNPTRSQVKSFVAEQHRRFLTGEPCGPSGEAAYEIRSGSFFPSEEEWLAGAEGSTIALTSVLHP